LPITCVLLFSCVSAAANPPDPKTDVFIRPALIRVGQHGGLFLRFDPAIDLTSWPLSLEVLKGGDKIDGFKPLCQIQRDKAVLCKWSFNAIGSGLVKVRLGYKTNENQKEYKIVEPYEFVVSSLSRSVPVPGPLTIMVSDFSSYGISPEESAVVTELLRQELFSCGAGRIVDKGAMKRVMAEQAFQQTGCTELECAVKLGRLLKAEYIVTGALVKKEGSCRIKMGLMNVNTFDKLYEHIRKDWGSIPIGIGWYWDEADANTALDMESRIALFAKAVCERTR